MTELFTPFGATDTVNKAQAAAQPMVIPVNEPVPAEPFVVPVRQDQPEITVPRTLQLSATNPFTQILPMDMQRRRALIIPIANAIWLSENKDLASQANGNTAATAWGSSAWVPAGTVFEVQSRAQLWATVSTTASTTAVAVMVERYIEPMP